MSLQQVATDQEIRQVLKKAQTRDILRDAEDSAGVSQSKSIKNNDAVNHPAYYNRGSIEVADFIIDQKLPWTLGTAVKYLCRAGYKDPTKDIEDLEKAKWYIDREIREIKWKLGD